MNIQSVLAVAVVLCAVVCLAFMAKRKGGSCASGCGCSSSPKKDGEK